MNTARDTGMYDRLEGVFVAK